MDVQIAVKGIQYSFSKSQVTSEVKRCAEQAVKSEFLDEQEKFNAALADGSVSSQHEYALEFGFDVLKTADYTKTFEDNRGLHEVEQEIEKYCNKYMGNIKDLPSEAIVTIDDEYINKGVANELAVRQALTAKYGVNVVGYYRSCEAKKKDFMADKAYTEIGEMMKSDDYLTYLNLRANIDKYSHNNISMIYAQKPNATAVMGMKEWNKYDRLIDKGTTGIAIWQPKKREFRTKEQIERYFENHKDDYRYQYDWSAEDEKEDLLEQLEKKGKAELLIGFDLGYVFDVSQTTCVDPTYDFFQSLLDQNKILNATIDNFSDVVKALNVASINDPSVNYRIDVPLNVAAHQQQDTIFDSVLNYANRLLKDAPSAVAGIKSTTAYTGDMHKIESIMAAHLICKHIGIDCDEKAGIQLIGLMNNKDNEQLITEGKRQMFMKAFDRACKLADQITQGFDKEMGIDLDKEKSKIKDIAAQVQEERKKEQEQRAVQALNARYIVDPENENRLIYKTKKGNKRGVLIQDKWSSKGVDYLLLEDEQSGKFMVDLDINGKQGFLHNDGEEEGAKMFTYMPSRADIEYIAQEQIQNTTTKTNKPFERV